MLSVREHRKTGARPGNEGLASMSSTFEVPLRCASCNVQQMLKNFSYQDLQIVNLIHNGVNRLATGWAPEVPSHSRQSNILHSEPEEQSTTLASHKRLQRLFEQPAVTKLPSKGEIPT